MNTFTQVIYTTVESFYLTFNRQFYASHSLISVVICVYKHKLKLHLDLSIKRDKKISYFVKELSIKKYPINLLGNY